MVKALDLRSNVRMHTWVRTPFLVWEPGPFFFFFTNLITKKYASKSILDLKNSNSVPTCTIVHLQYFKCIIIIIGINYFFQSRSELPYM